MATSDTNYSRPRGDNYKNTRESNYNKSGASSFSKQKNNNYSKPTDNNFRSNNFKNKNQDKNSNFRKNLYSKSGEVANNHKQQGSYLDSEKESDIDNDVFFEKQEAQKRLEREIKIKRRKDKKEDTIPKIKKANGKTKRLKNIDWTKGYEDGLFDDDEFYDDYLI